MDIKIFGERNTGTRALAKIIANNSRSFVYEKKEAEMFGAFRHLLSAAKFLHVKRSYRQYVKDYIYLKQDLAWQWKHCATNFETLGDLKNVHFIFMVRDPLSWLLSFHKNPYERLIDLPEEFGEFIQCEWRTSGRERLNRRTFSPVELYEKKLLHYRKFMHRLEENNITYSLIRFEDLIRDQESEYQKIKKFLDSPLENFRELKRSTKNRPTDLDYYKNYYNNALWINEIPFEIRKKFHFNEKLMDWLNYDARCYVET